MIKRLFLTSSIGTPGVAASVYSKIGSNKPLKTAFITTPVEPPSEQEDLSWLKEDRDAMVSAGFMVFDYTVTGKTRKQLDKDLGDIDVLYVSGGDTPYLLQQSRASGFVDFVHDFVNKGRPYVSTSAGSIITGPVMPGYLIESDASPRLSDTTCYHIVNFTVLPHWGSPWFKERYLNGRMAEIYAPDDVPYILLNDNEYVEVNGDWYRIVDVRSEK